jgi:hypothetical protein
VGNDAAARRSRDRATAHPWGISASPRIEGRSNLPRSSLARILTCVLAGGALVLDLKIVVTLASI